MNPMEIFKVKNYLLVMKKYPIQLANELTWEITRIYRDTPRSEYRIEDITELVHCLL